MYELEIKYEYIKKFKDLEAKIDHLVLSFDKLFCSDDYRAKLQSDILALKLVNPETEDYFKVYQNLSFLEKEMIQRQNSYSKRVDELEEMKRLQQKCIERCKQLNQTKRKVLDSCHGQNNREEILRNDNRVNILWHFISNASANEFQLQFEQIKNELIELESFFNSRYGLKQEEVIIPKMISLIDEWKKKRQIYPGTTYYQNMIYLCNEKLNNRISWDDLLLNVQSLISKSNDQFRVQRYHLRQNISDNDWDKFRSLYETL